MIIYVKKGKQHHKMCPEGAKRCRYKIRPGFMIYGILVPAFWLDRMLTSNRSRPNSSTLVQPLSWTYMRTSWKIPIKVVAGGIGKAVFKGIENEWGSKKQRATVWAVTPLFIGRHDWVWTNDLYRFVLHKVLELCCRLFFIDVDLYMISVNWGQSIATVLYPGFRLAFV